MGIDEYLTAVRRHWRVAVAAVGIAIAVAWVTATVAPPQPATASYTATAVVLNSGSFSGPVPNAAATSLDTVATLATLDPVVERVASVIGYEGDPRTLVENVAAVADENSPGIVRITASSVDPQDAVKVANAFANELIAYLHIDRQRAANESLERVDDQLVDISNEIASIDELLPTASTTQTNVLLARQSALTNQVSLLSGLYQQYLRESLEPPAFELVEGATPVAVSSEGYQAPRSRSARVLVGAIIGLVGGFVIALILHRFDRRIRTAETAERAFEYRWLQRSRTCRDTSVRAS